MGGWSGVFTVSFLCGDAGTGAMFLLVASMKIFQRGAIATQKDVLCSSITTLTWNLIDLVARIDSNAQMVARSVAMLKPMRPSSSRLIPERCVGTAVAARASDPSHELASVC